MPKTKFNKWIIKANKDRGFYRPKSGERHLTIKYAIFQSAAYADLSFSARVVLFDWIRLYFDKSGWESTTAVEEKGIRYSFEVCDVPCINDNTFFRARAEVVAHGFFDKRDDLKSLVPCSPNVFTPSEKWKDFPSTAKYDRWKQSRDKRLKKTKNNRAKAIEWLEEHRDENK